MRLEALSSRWEERGPSITHCRTNIDLQFHRTDRPESTTIPHSRALHSPLLLERCMLPHRLMGLEEEASADRLFLPRGACGVSNGINPAARLSSQLHQQFSTVILF